MSKNLSEGSASKDAAANEFNTRQLLRRPADKSNAVLFIKIFSDQQVIVTGDGKFIFEVSRDMDNRALVDAEAYVTTVGTGATTVTIYNLTQAVDMLSTAISVDSGDLNSKDAGTQPVINTLTSDVEWGDQIEVNVDAAASNAQGLGVMLTFS